jgi:hypothetical protein
MTTHLEPPLPPEPEDDDWSPSDGHWTIRQAIAEARAGIQAGKKRLAHRQALIEQRRTRHDQGDK